MRLVPLAFSLPCVRIQHEQARASRTPRHTRLYLFLFFLFLNLSILKKTLFLRPLSNTQHGASAQAAGTVRCSDVAIIVTQIVLSYVYIAVYPRRPTIILVQISFLIFEKVAVGFFVFVAVVEEERFAITSVRQLLDLVVSENLLNC